MKFAVFLGLAIASLFPVPLQAATLQVTYVNNTPPASGYADATRVTFRFANDIDNATSFQVDSFVDRIWHKPELLPQGVGNVLALLGLYPGSNLIGTTVSGSFTYDHQGEIGAPFSLREYQPNGNFYPASFSYYNSSTSLTLIALWDAVPNGSVFRFIRESFEYNPTGSAADFSVVTGIETPVPAAALLFGSVVLGAGALRTMRRRRSRRSY